MKKLFILIAAIGIFACSGPERDTFVLNVSVPDIPEGKAFLQDRISGLMVNLDSVEFTNGSFVLKGSLDTEKMLYLSIEGLPGRISIFMENSEISLTINQIEPVQFTIKGSESHEIFVKLSAISEPFDETLRSLQQQILQAEMFGDSEKADLLRDSHAETEQERKKAVSEGIAVYSDRPVAVFVATRQLMSGADGAELRRVFSKFDTSLAGTRYYDELQRTVEALERVAVGQPAIEISLENTDGEIISLSDFRGNIVLISFWASWCPYCRQSNPELVKIYEEFGGRNFEVFGVSLDRNHDAWLKGIAEDGLKWPQVSDLRGWQSGPAGEYAIRSIPQNVLVDQNGIIIARNLKYNELEKKLEALLAAV